MARTMDKRLDATVDIMDSEWCGIIARTGDLTLDDMRKSLQRARYRGHKVVIPKVEATWIRMQHIFMGEVIINGC